MMYNIRTAEKMGFTNNTATDNRYPLDPSSVM